MSKIIEALEKAKHEGNLEQTSGAVGERETLAPVGASAPSARVRRRKRSAEPGLITARTLDAQVVRGVDPHVQTLHNPMSVVSEQYRALRNRLERLSSEAELHAVAVTSSVKGEGKSLTAVNLAVAMAQDSTQRILLVDADLRRPAVHRLLALDLSPGLADCLQGSSPWEEVVRRTPFFDLSVVAAGDAKGHPGELLASPEFKALLQRARAEFDYIIVDTPPLHPISDVTFLADSVDGILVVVQANRTSKGIVKQAIEQLPPHKVIGTVLNRAESLGRGYGYGRGGYYYYKYY